MSLPKSAVSFGQQATTKKNKILNLVCAWFTFRIYYFAFLMPFALYELRRMNWMCCAKDSLQCPRYTFHLCHNKHVVASERKVRIRRVLLRQKTIQNPGIINCVMLFDFWFKQNVCFFFFSWDYTLLFLFFYSSDSIPLRCFWAFVKSKNGGRGSVALETFENCESRAYQR